MVTSQKTDGWQAIVSNVERLIHDAKLLQDNERYASAMSTAILAFEESGKGSNHELNLGISPKGSLKGYSWHMLRQILSSLFLVASVKQKYDVVPTIPEELIRAMKTWQDSFQNMKERASAPIPEGLRETVVQHLQRDEQLINKIARLGSEDRFIFTIELRWARKLLVASMSGQTEKMRQRGMYVDLDGDTVTSTPTSIDGTTSLYWIQAAERALLILRDGNLYAPYGNLAAYLEGLTKPFDPMVEARKMDTQIKWLQERFI